MRHSRLFLKSINQFYCVRSVQLCYSFEFEGLDLKQIERKKFAFLPFLGTNCLLSKHFKTNKKGLNFKSRRTGPTLDFFYSITGHGIQIHGVNGGIYKKRAYSLIRNRNAAKAPFLASIDYLSFRSFQSDFSELSLTVSLYFKCYIERKYSETKYYINAISQWPITLPVTLAWPRWLQIIVKVLLKWRKLFIIQITKPNVEARRFILKGTGTGQGQGRLQSLLVHTALLRR